MNQDLVKYALQNLLHRKLRSGLSILSIMIGITAIFTLVSFGLGIQHYIDTVADESGGDKVFIQPKGVGAPGTDDNFYLSQEDVDFVEKITGVNELVAMYYRGTEIEHKNQKKINFGIGFDPKKTRLVEEAFSADIVAGRGLKQGDKDKVVLGYNYQIENKIFKNPLSVGDKFSLNSQPFEVVGFYSEVGNPSDDANIYFTDEGFESLFPSAKGRYGSIMVRADPDADPQELAERIQEKLRKFKDQEKGKEDFYAQTFDDLLATFNTIINVINGVLILIAFISLIVASVNIMNTMYTAVLERTKEIGVMKSIGATRNSILFVFVFEAGVLGLIGGSLGVILGYLFATAGGQAAAAGGYALLQPIFPAYLIIGCLLFSFVVGALAGLLPALQAAKLNPTEALRYE